jgi:hypothetical protein
MVLSNRQRTRLLRQAVADLYVAAGGTDGDATDVDRFVHDPRAAREARIAVSMANRGQLRNGNGESA